MKDFFLNSEYLFWIAWIIIPLIVEIIPAIGNFVFLIFKYFKNKRQKSLSAINIIADLKIHQEKHQGKRIAFRLF